MRRLVLFALVFAACPKPMDPGDSGMPEDSGSPEDAGRDAGRPPRPDAGVDAGWVNVLEATWCESRATAQCWRDIRCSRIGTSRFDECVARRRTGCDSTVYVTGSTLGLHSYDSAAATRCLNAYAAGNCEAEPPECTGIFTGHSTPDGGRGALVREDCDGDAGYFYASGQSCPETCRPWARLDEPCFDSSGTYSTSCQPGVHSCDYNDAGTFTTVCVPLQGEDAGCSWFYGCGPNLTCSGNKCVKQVAAVGEACSKTANPTCDSESFCRQDTPATGEPPPGICSPRAGIGGTCVGFLTSYRNTCIESLRCSSSIGTGTCTPRLDVGEPCTSPNGGFYPPDCMDGLYCNNSSSRCAPLPADGGDCSRLTGSYYLCAPGFFCDLNVGERCRALLADGEACAGDDLRCLSGNCQYGPIPDSGTSGYRCVRCAPTDGG